jgi:hypothetical protein
MANFQFGQDNVGAGWGNLPSGYVQGMSASPMATGISGIAAAIANAAQQYQQARQNAFMEQLKQKQLAAEQQRISLRPSRSRLGRLLRISAGTTKLPLVFVESSLENLSLLCLRISKCHSKPRWCCSLHTDLSRQLLSTTLGIHT